MSEVDRLSNSGLYPALPIADRQRGKDESGGKPSPDPHADKSGPQAGDRPDPPGPRPPKSLIDEYA
ncbi:MAG: hypothetical protein JWN43_3952 [Gammaproteobacteria bacterium]|nr:hypothetical protein [Gammaproteobacteria bacterium]